MPSPTGIGSMASVVPTFSCNDNAISKSYAIHDSWAQTKTRPCAGMLCVKACLPPSKAEGGMLSVQSMRHVKSGLFSR